MIKQELMLFVIQILLLSLHHRIKSECGISDKRYLVLGKIVSIPPASAGRQGCRGFVLNYARMDKTQSKLLGQKLV